LGNAASSQRPSKASKERFKIATDPSTEQTSNAVEAGGDAVGDELSVAIGLTVFSLAKYLAG
jgi:hypothetical protein